MYFLQSCSICPENQKQCPSDIKKKENIHYKCVSGLNLCLHTFTDCTVTEYEEVNFLHIT